MRQQSYNCKADAEQAVAQFNRRWKYHQVHAQITAQRQYARRGRPAADDQQEVVGVQLNGEVLVSASRVKEAQRSFGKLILGTNQLDAQRLVAAEMLATYIDQGISVERGFRFLKDPRFFAHSLFLKKLERIMALVIIMGLALLIFALAEHWLHLAQPPLVVDPHGKHIQAFKSLKDPAQSRRLGWSPLLVWDGLAMLLERHAQPMLIAYEYIEHCIYCSEPHL